MKKEYVSTVDDTVSSVARRNLEPNHLKFDDVGWNSVNKSKGKYFPRTYTRIIKTMSDTRIQLIVSMIGRKTNIQSEPKYLTIECSSKENK